MITIGTGEQVIWADQDDNGDLSDWVQSQLGWRVEIAKRTTAKQQKEKAWDIAR